MGSNRVWSTAARYNGPVRKILIAAVAVVFLSAVGVGFWLASGDDVASPAPTAEQLSARETLERHLAEGRGVAAADWIRGGQITEGGEAGRHARYTVVGQGGRVALAYLVTLDDGIWRLVSLTEGAPQCAAVERYGFPSAMIADCRVGEAQTVAEALQMAIEGGDVSGVRLVGQITLPPDPSCNCVLLTSGGASVRLNISASALAAAGISVGDTVVISGGLGADLSVDASSVIRATEDGTPESVANAGNPSSSDGKDPDGRDDDSGDDDDDGSSPGGPTGPAPEPPVTTPGAGGVAGAPAGKITVEGFPEWKPRLRYTTRWYETPLDLDTSVSEVPTLSQ